MSTTAERWRRVIQQQHASGLTVAAFCRRSGLSQPSFYSWRQKLRGEVTFAEVKVSPAPAVKAVETMAADSGGIELRLPGGWCVVVQPGFDRQALIDLLHVLETSSSDRATRGTVA